MSTATTAAGGPGPQPPNHAYDDLLEALSREQKLRREAEGKLNQTSKEVEELSVTLFEQANEMVASERRARAALEERVETLESRERDKRHRLERLEAAVGRIERVRSVLGEVEKVAAAAAAAVAGKEEEEKGARRASSG